MWKLAQIQLPIGLAGHCQIKLNNGNIFIFGGVTDFKYYNGSEEFYQHSKQSYKYINSTLSWMIVRGLDSSNMINIKTCFVKVPNENPCPLPEYEAQFEQPCAHSNESVVIVTHTKDSHCTAILNLDTLSWNHRHENQTEMIIPIAGYLIV